MKGRIIHTITCRASRMSDESSKVVFKSQKSSPGYEEYYPTYTIVENIQGIETGGLLVNATVKSFRSEYLIVEAATDFDSGSAQSILKIKDSLNNEAEKIARCFSDLNLREEYTFFCVSGYDSCDDILENERPLIAKLLRDESAELTESEIKETFSNSLRYDRDDLTVIDWDGSLLLDIEGEFGDNITLIELANIQLLSLRALDGSLTAEISMFRKMVDLRSPNIFRLSRLLWSIIKVRSKSLFDLDAIDNSIKLYGDWYDAKVYSIAARKLYIDKWRRAVEDKLTLLEKMFEMVSQRQGEVYNIVLELSIVLLIVLEIVILV